MKSYGQRVSQFHQGFRSLDVDTGIFVQYPQDYAIHPELLGGKDIVAHDVEFVAGVTKAAGPGANQNVDGNAHVAANGLHESRAGSDSAGRQVAAKLNPVSTPALGRDGVLHRFYANLKHETVLHFVALENRMLRFAASGLVATWGGIAIRKCT
jgi:hypothetical protein